MIHLSPRSMRIVYDLVILYFTSLSLFLANSFFQKDSDIIPAVLSPLFAVFIFWAFGIFDRLRKESIYIKASAITVGLGLSSGVCIFLFQSSFFNVLWFLCSLPPIIAPRYFINWAYPPLLPDPNNKSAQEWVLVVGGAGYIGSHVVSQLLDKKYKVRVLDKLFYGDDSLSEFQGNPNFQLVIGDATDISRLTLALQGVKSIIHLAGLVGDPACAVDTTYTRHTNIISTRMLKEAAKAFGIKRFIFASSCSVYGASDEKVNENSNLNPVSLYAQTKIDSEKELLQAHDEDLTVTILRFATVFGHSRRPRFDLVVNLFTAQAYNEKMLTVVGPNQWRPFIHCSDVARACVVTMEAPTKHVAGEIFNVGDDRLNMTIGDLGKSVQSVAKKMGIHTQVSVSDDIKDRRNYLVSFDKIKSRLHFTSSLTVEQGVDEMLNHLKLKTYQHYKTPIYSNLEITKQQVGQFYDPMHNSTLYMPISEMRKATLVSQT
jgi:nucleoside-diphosphate-sugar epimerase